MTLDIIDPLGWVKRSRMRFFPGGQIDVIRLLAYVMSDVLELGRGECRIVQRDGWWFVTSDVDWLAHELSVGEFEGVARPFATQRCDQVLIWSRIRHWAQWTRALAPARRR